MHKIIELQPTEITVREGLDRYRTDMGDIRDLATSILKHGQLQPIIITEQHELVAGGRRLAACIFASKPVLAVYKNALTNDMLRLIEIEENVRRKQFTPAEEELAVAELHRIKLKEAGGATVPGPKSAQAKAKQWTLNDTAALLGKSRAAVISSLQNADAIVKNPELKNAKTKSEISSRAKKIDVIATAVSRAQKNAALMEEKKTTFKLSQGHALDFLSGFNNEADIVVVDPPYMIDINAQRHTNNTVAADYDDTDGDENSWLYNELPDALYSATRETAHCFMFVAREAKMYYKMYACMVDAGWDTMAWPIIWVKGVSGQCTAPDRRPGNCWEAILYARKPRARFVREGMPDWVQCDPIPATAQKRHAEKPVALLENLIARAAMPGQKLIDPCMGTGSAIEAGVRMKLECFGNDKDPDAYALALERMAKYAK